MLKKYFPFIILLAAGGLLFYVKSHQRGREPVSKVVRVETDPVRNDTNPAEYPVRTEPFNRHERIIYSTHAKCRMECRHIDESEIKEILETGTLNSDKIESDARGKTYPLEGVTHDHQRIRVVFAPKDDGLLVVTCIDLDKDWPCDCK